MNNQQQNELAEMLTDALEYLNTGRELSAYGLIQNVIDILKNDQNNQNLL